MKKFKILTLGCKANQYESQLLFDQLEYESWEECVAAPDLIIINTCSVTHQSDKSSLALVRAEKKRYPKAKIIATGCAVDFCKQEVDDIIYVSNLHKDTLLQDCGIIRENVIDHIQRFHRHTRAFVKVQDGCNNFCSYCVIPYHRNTVKSRDITHVLKEVSCLCKQGHTEIVLTGINLGSFQPHLCDLLEVLETVPSLRRIRLSSINPEDVDDRLINFLQSSQKMAHSMHISLQSGSDKILKMMKRRYSIQKFRSLAQKIYTKMPFFAITTDIIVGFPSEEEKDFQDSLNIVEELQFARVHIFPFSAREKTEAATYPNQILPGEIEERKHRLEKITQKASFSFREKFIGQIMEVLLERPSKNIAKLYTCTNE